MKKYFIFLSVLAGMIISSCTSSYQAASSYDDLYYSPGDQVVKTTKIVRTEVVQPENVGNNNSSQMNKESADPDQRSFDEYNQYYTQLQQTDTTLKQGTFDEEYFDDGTSYEERIEKFSGSSPYSNYYNNYYDYGSGGGYYDPYYGSSWGFSLGFNWGWGSMYYGYGYPYYGYGYYPYYDPWYYPYYGYCCYDYYYGGGGYYPSPYYSYGPRQSRSPHNSPDDNRVNRNNNDENDYAQTRDYRQGNASGSAGGEIMKDQRDYRSYQPVNQDQGRTGQAVNTNNDQNIRQQRELKPNVSQESANIVPETIDKMSKPGEQANPGDIGSRNARNQSNQPVAQEKQQRNYSKPGTTQQKYQARTPQNYQQQKKYEKPGVSNERKSGQVQSYTPPSYSKPRSSKDYSNFGARSYKPENRQTPKMDNSPGQPTQQKNVRNYSKTVLPKTGSHLPSQREGSNYSSPSTPQRSYSSPSPSSSPSRSYSAPSSSSPSRSSGSGSSGGSSGSPRKSR